MAITGYQEKSFPLIPVSVPDFAKLSKTGRYTWRELVECFRCGGTGYFPTQRHGACFLCMGAKVREVTKHAQTKERGDRLNANAQAKWDAHAKVVADRVLKIDADLNFNQLSDLFAWVGGLLKNDDDYETQGGRVLRVRYNPFCFDILCKAHKFDYTEKQIEALKAEIQRCVELDYASWNADKVAKVRTIESGKGQVFVGKCVSIKSIEGFYGHKYMAMFIADVDGGEVKIWMNAGDMEVGQRYEVKVTIDGLAFGEVYKGLRPKTKLFTSDSIAV